MTVLARERAPAGGLSPAYAAVRARLCLVALLLALAAVGWAWTAREMRGMDDGPWTGLGGYGWFTGVWVVMMAAMMLPSAVPTIALYARVTKQRSMLLPLLFTTGYLLVWAVTGMVARAVGRGASLMWGDALSWGHAGRAIAGVTLLVAAAYEVTPLKDVCLSKCRSPLGAFLGSWRGGYGGAVRMGVKNGTWCVGCCWALMASLFALGVMSASWMAFVAALVAVEKTLPRKGIASAATATLLFAIGVVLLAAPGALPGLTMPSAAMTR